MTMARRARQVGAIGSLGAASKVLTPGEALPNLVILGASINYGDKEIPIFDGSKWLTKRFPARREEDVTFRIFLQGASKNIVGAVFEDPNQKPCYLFVRRLGPGEHFINVQIPYNALPKFRFVVATKVDARIDTRFLSDREVRGLTQNMLLISETKNAFYTDSLGGLGSAGGSSTTASPAYVPGASNRRTASGKFKLWSGKLSEHRWKTHGYSGRKEAGRSTAKGEAAVEGPWYVCDRTGYYAFRGSTYQMTYDKNGRMLGYDAMENLDRGMPAGVPIAMVMQYFVHDPVKTAGVLAGPGGYDNLGLGVPKWAKKAGSAVKKGAKATGGAIKSGAEATAKGVKTVADATGADTALEFVGEKTIAATKATGRGLAEVGEFTVDVTLDTAEATVNFAKDPSISNAVSIVTAPFGLNTCWHYADKVSIHNKNIFFIDENMYYENGSVKNEKDNDGLVTTFADASAIPYKLNKGTEVLRNFKDNKGRSRNKSDFGFKVEWYNPSTKRWSSPSVHPPFSPKTDSKGKFVIIMRFPRQLDPIADREAIQAGVAAGYSNYGWDQTNIKTAYPIYDQSSNMAFNKKYRLLGRVEGKDSDSEMARVFTQTINGVPYQGRRSLKAVLWIRPPSHSRAMLSQAASGSMNTFEAFKVHIADPGKFTYLDNPEIDNSYYVEGEMKPGSVVVVLGKALGTINSRNCILTTRGFQTDGIIPNSQLGRKTPPGDTPAFVAQNVIMPNANKPRTATGKEGTNRADYLELAGHITADDLKDDKLVSGEAVLRQTWKAIFGKELSAQWFSQNQLPNQNPKNPLHYTIQGSKGETYSFPYSIAWFKIPRYYTGPYLDYDDEGKLQTIEGRPYAISDDKTPLYIVMSTPFEKTMQQKFDIVAETKQQAQLEELGYEPDEILAVNEMDFDAQDITEIVEVDNREREFNKRTKQGDYAPAEKKKMVRYTDSWFKANYKFGNDDVVLKPKKEPVALGAFSNQGNFYVEDWTERMPASDEVVGFSGLGAGWDSFQKGAKEVGKAGGNIVGNFTAQTAKAVVDADLGPKEVAVLGGAAGLAGLVAIGMTYAVVTGGGSGVAKVVRAPFDGIAKIVRARGAAKEDIIEAKAEAKIRKKEAGISGMFGRSQGASS